MMSPDVRRKLARAAERIGDSQYRIQMAAHVRKGRKASTFRFYVTPAHRAVVDALGSRTMTDQEAMALLWEHDVMAERLA